MDQWLFCKTKKIKSLVQNGLPKCLWIFRKSGAFVFQAIFELLVRCLYWLDVVLLLRFHLSAQVWQEKTME